ncbi:MAG: histone deacetylase [Planctomycetota bacterium]
MRAFSSVHYYTPLPAGHVFPMQKFPQSAAWLVADGTIARAEDPGMIARTDLLRVHTAEYVDAIRDATLDEQTARKLGLPTGNGLSLRSHAAAAGTLAAAQAALTNGIAANLAGGTHHAFADRGEGFCVFNDVAIAIRALRNDEPWLRVIVVDLDAHQGNGTNALFAEDPATFTFNMHVGRNYPSTKVPGDIDIGLPRFVDGPRYLSELRTALPEAIRRADADLAFYVSGADPHEEDRFGQMRLTTAEMAERDRHTIGTLRDAGLPVCVLYGGGYSRVPGMTAALHCQTVRIAAIIG